MSPYGALVVSFSLAVTYTLAEQYIRPRIIRQSTAAARALRLDRSGGNVFWIFPFVKNAFFSQCVLDLPPSLKAAVRVMAIFQVVYVILFSGAAAVLVMRSG